jgi:hypothetical protein
VFRIADDPLAHESARIAANAAIPEETSSVKRYPRDESNDEAPSPRHPATALPAESEISRSETPVSISVTSFSKPETKLRNCYRGRGNLNHCLSNFFACAGSSIPNARSMKGWAIWSNVIIGLFGAKVGRRRRQ